MTNTIRTTIISGAALLSSAVSQTTNANSHPSDSLPPSPLRIVWQLDGTNAIAGRIPQIFGAPKIVSASDGGPALRFNGKTDGLIVPANPMSEWPVFTVEVLFRPDLNGPRAQRFLHIADHAGNRVLLETRTTSDGKFWVLDTYLACCNKKGRTLRNRAKRHQAGKWVWVALVYDGQKMTEYVNGVREFEGHTRFPPMTDGVTALGMRLNQVFWFKGSLKEIRFHPVALATEALQRAK